MAYKWGIFDHHLAIEDDAEFIHPKADEIYRLLDGEIIEDILIHNPEKDLPDIRFSRVGAPVKCKVYVEEKGKHIILSIYALRKKSPVPVDVIEGHIIDHCLVNGEWFYLTGDLPTVEKWLTEAGIESNGPITIQQYLILRKNQNFEKINLIEFDVSEEALHKSVEIIDSSVPVKLNATLYSYQMTGYQWMHYMLDESGGCILGDEMGLGKTIQVITVFLSMIAKKQVPIIVIAPVSLLENWKMECAKFAPSINTYIHHGPNRTGRYSDLEKHDVVIISYNSAISDLSMLKMIQWSLVVVDEAQNIKNPDSERSKAIRNIPRLGSIAVSGTPFENHIQDIWSLVDFVIPGLFGDLTEFKETYPDDEDGAQRVEPILTPIMLRRLVKDVAKDLPEKIVIPQPIEMPLEEAEGYEKIRTATENVNSESISLGAIQRLRMYCTFPSLCDNESCTGDPAHISLKYQRLCEITEEIVQRKEKVLVFTSFKKMFDIFNNDIPSRFDIPVWNINGETPVEDRQQFVDKFNQYDGPAMLVLNPRAAGTGLNITGANHVIHFNPEWNPALEDQASARAYRRGQKKTVFVYRLFYSDTVEEMVNERIERKRVLAGAAIVGNDGTGQDKKDLIAAIKLSPIIQRGD